MLGLLKILITAAVVGGAVAGIRALIQRGRQASQPTGNEPVEMTQCSACAIYVTGACDRPDCPLA